MVQTVTFNTSQPSIGGLAAIELVKETNPISVEWGHETTIVFRGSANKFAGNSDNDVLRAVARDAPKYQLYGQSPAEQSQIDHWLTFSLSFGSNLTASLDFLQKSLAPLTYLVANHLTIADLAVFGELQRNFEAAQKIGVPAHVQRWYNLVKEQPAVLRALSSLPDTAKQALKAKPVTKKATGSNERKQEGKFVELPGAEMGKVVVRFPPEASGYLHIGHAKAALLNQYYALAFDGTLIMRFDDTNPAKETVEFEQVILGDLEMLQIKPDLFTHTSQYFDLMLEYCERLMADGKAYVDDTEPEQMKKERELRTESANRQNSLERNLQMWKEMLKGSAVGQKCCVRAKIDMSSNNGCLRDPTIYRCKNEPHPRTGTKYKVYPTYDFACPIVDAIENVTHTLRTMEYHDRDDQFYWFIDALKLRKPYIWEYSRLNMTNTVLSKRKLTWFVEEGLVDGWDDPRFPTVRGILRRGMTVQGLREFIIAQGSSKSVVFMEWDKIWAFNKKVIDPIAPRYTALEREGTVVVNVAGISKPEATRVAAHPKNEEVGQKTVWVGPRVLIDHVDAVELKEGENATFINWGNLLIKKIHRDAAGRVTSVDANLNLDNKDFKKTIKLTWLYEGKPEDFPPTYCVYFDHIVNKAVLAKEEDFKQFIGHETRKEVPMLGDPELKNRKEGDIIQLQRRGFFRVDQAYKPASSHSGVEQPVVLFEIPDGHQKEKQTGGKATVASAGAAKATTKVAAAINSASDLDSQIATQGNIVRDLKAQKAAKPEVDAAVKKLLALKADYKTATGQDWKPGSTPAPVPTAAAAPASAPGAAQINEEIVKQGLHVRSLKEKKADKATVTESVNKLLALKAKYKQATGADWTPGCSPPQTVPVAAPTAAPATAGNAVQLNEEICKQGLIVRALKEKKADKAAVTEAVNTLLALKAQYKGSTGQEWKPGCTPPGAPATAPASAPASVQVPSDAAQLNEEITKQGQFVRSLKEKKADKATVSEAVSSLLALKQKYKQATGQDWTPSTTPSQVVASAPVTAPAVASNAVQLNDEICKQGLIVRALKEKKAEKAAVTEAVNTLLALKARYKGSTGQEWKPGCTPPQAAMPATTPTPAPAGNDRKQQLTNEITKQGETVRTLKSSGAAKAEVDKAVAALLELKGKYKSEIGEDFPVAGGRGGAVKKSNPPKEQKKEAKKEKPKPAAAEAAKEDGSKKQTRLGLEAKKEENLPEWYSQVLTKGELIEYYDVSGCYILRHWSFSIWKVIQNWFTAEIEKLGVKEVYFPLFVSRAALEKEKDHIADFSPEVAWVTKSGETDLAEPVAIRPTSETVMYPAFSKWVQSYRDLPIRINQWSNVVRWEFKHPQPFLRTREFLWQEGHTAYAVKADAEAEVLTILDLYARVYTDLLAVPVVKGRKTEKEKFAGGDYTTTVEAYISASGRAIQGGTSHHLGQNFSKMFDIIYDDPVTQEKKFAYQNSWGLTTRTIGVMIMVHADNRGLVLPPNVASIQAIVVPCGLTVKTTEADQNSLLKACSDVEVTLKNAGVRAEGDYRDNYSPGWKFNHWELKGVPIRIELGPKDISSKQLVAVRRDTGEKITIPLAEATQRIPALLKEIHENMLARADKDLKDNIKIAKDWSEFCTNLDKNALLLSPFCGEQDCEGRIKAESARDQSEIEAGALAMGAKSLCIPFEQPTSILPSDKCVHHACKKAPKFYCLFGRSY